MRQNAGDAGELNTFGTATGNGENRQALQYFFLITTNSVPNKPAVNKAIGRIIRIVITTIFMAFNERNHT